MATVVMAPSASAAVEGAWWAPGPRIVAAAIASTSAPTTLVATARATYWVNPATGEMAPTGLRSPATAVAVTAGGTGVAALRDGSVQIVAAGGTGPVLATLATPVRALAAAGTPAAPLAIAATSRGIWLLRPRRQPLRLVAGVATAVIAPVLPGLPWWALVNGRLYGSRDGTVWGAARHTAPLPPTSHILVELGDGTVLAAEPSGLVLASSARGLVPDLQILPSGGLAGVPEPTGLTAVGSTSAYLATRGFATLLTPDDGYDWYRAAPSELPSTIEAVASVGPVFASRQPHGDVVAAGPARLYIHRLQSLPAPPVYIGGTATLELAGTAATTFAAILVGLSGLALLGPRRRRSRFTRPV
ncbi:MAG TPA: hypothetical protein VMW47_11995 [Verrucomicrobiae bacterium]|nr:hypothetical protein [Verrucomicrobiae bacterium]